METKFEYQVSPELAEKIASEQFDLILRKRGRLPRYGPLIIAVLFAFWAASTSTPLKINGVDHPLAGRLLNSLFGFVVGLGIGLLFRHLARSGIRARARAASEKIGPLRTVSWNSEGLAIKGTALETKIGWPMIDTIQIERFGVYGLSNGQIYFAIAKTAFPSDATAENLIQTWQTQLKQPPPIISDPKE